MPLCDFALKREHDGIRKKTPARALGSAAIRGTATGSSSEGRVFFTTLIEHPLRAAAEYVLDDRDFRSAEGSRVPDRIVLATDRLADGGRVRGHRLAVDHDFPRPDTPFDAHPVTDGEREPLRR